MFCFVFVGNSYYPWPKFGFYSVKVFLSLSHSPGGKKVITLTDNFFSGGFAFVYEAQDLGSGREYALKVITNDGSFYGDFSLL